MKKELKLERRPCWIIWAIMSSGATVIKAVCLSKIVADHYVIYARKQPMVERVFVEKSRTDHLYFGMFEMGARTKSDVKAALKRAREEYRNCAPGKEAKP